MIRVGRKDGRNERERGWKREEGGKGGREGDEEETDGKVIT